MAVKNSRSPSICTLPREFWYKTTILGLCWAYLAVPSSGSTILAPKSDTTALGTSNDTEPIILKILPENRFDSFPNFARDTADYFPMPDCNGMILEESTVDGLQHAMREGRLTSVTIATCYLHRIYQTNEYIKCVRLFPINLTPRISNNNPLPLCCHLTVGSAIMQLNPDLLQIASALDAERVAGHIRGPLHGIPFLIKDNIATKDRMETTAGSWALLGSIVPRDAHVVARLRQQGALLLGKATLSEWADMRSSNYSEGYSARGGQARSPYNLTVNPGGSSSGSAAAVAGNLCMFALGTETDGSVINPAERNALVGIKPTVGLTSRAGVVPESQHQDSVGTFARTVRDAVYALDAVYGLDPRDNYTFSQEGNVPISGYSQFLSDKNALKNATLGLPWQSFWVLADEEQRAALVEIVKEIEAAGATIINGTELKDWQKIVSPDGWDWYGFLHSLFLINITDNLWEGIMGAPEAFPMNLSSLW